MEILTLGVGEAADPQFPNAAVTVARDGFRLLIDCGHSVPPLLWRTLPEADAVDALYLTHRHPDHCFGLVPALIRWTDDGRRKPLTIVAAAEARATAALLLQAGGIDPARHLSFALDWRDPADTAAIGPFAAAYAPTRHAAPNLAIRLSAGGRSFCYSGDGRPTDDAALLYRGADLLFHECYLAAHDPSQAFHADHETLSTMLPGWGAAQVRFHHVRADQRDALVDRLEDATDVALARPGERIIL